MPRGGGNPGPRPQRYWTDYLRIALPIIGLILMLSVFIFWVGSIINGNDGNGAVTPTGEVALSTTTPVPGAANNVTATVAPAQSAAASSAGDAGSSPTETASDQPTAEPTTTPDESASTAPDQQPTDQPSPDEAPTETPGSGAAAFAVDDAVVTTESVNLRSVAASTDEGTIIRILDAGADLTIIGEPENDGEFDWYPVSDADGKGYVREDYLKAA